MEGLWEENKPKRLQTVTSGSVKCIWCKNGQDHQRCECDDVKQHESKRCWTDKDTNDI